MILSNLLKVLVPSAVKAYSTVATAANKSNAAKQTTTPASSGLNEHAQYIQDTYSGGLDAYTKLQNDRYKAALTGNDLDLLNKLQADANKVGYSLNSNISPVNPINNVNPYAALLEQNQANYDNLKKDYRNVLDASVNRGLGNLESQKGTINQSADDMARQAYILSRQNARNLPQQLASMGLTGGATETAQLGLQTNYETNLSNINRNRFDALNQIDTAKTDLKNQGELSYAEQALANNQAAINAYKNILDSSVGYDQWQSQFDYGTGRDAISDQRYNAETASATKQQEFNNILTRLGMGLISPQDAVTLGVPAADVQAFVNRINQAADLNIANSQAALSNKTSGGSSGGSGGDLSSGVIDAAVKYLQKGDRGKAIETLSSVMSNAEIKAFMEQNGIRTDDIDWGIEDTATTNIFDPNSPYQRFVGTPKLLEALIGFYKEKGYSDSQIASILNK